MLSFGMSSHTEDGFSDVGTLLYIRQLTLLPDGRSFVDTVGTVRFRVLERGVRDGYATARVEWLRDEDSAVLWSTKIDGEYGLESLSVSGAPGPAIEELTAAQAGAEAREWALKVSVPLKLAGTVASSDGSDDDMDVDGADHRERYRVPQDGSGLREAEGTETDPDAMLDFPVAQVAPAGATTGLPILRGSPVAPDPQSPRRTVSPVAAAAPVSRRVQQLAALYRVGFRHMAHADPLIPPDDLGRLSWWLVAFLPLPRALAAALLKSNSIEYRLKHVVAWMRHAGEPYDLAHRMLQSAPCALQ